MDNNMVERVAKAIRDTWGSVPYTTSDDNPDQYLLMARAAIAAMREPTNEMVWAAAKEKDRGSWWRAMIDAALEKEADHD